jgi:methionyl-tRNA formyltransferase
MSPSGYVVASCKPWHREAFDRIARQKPGPWEYVDTPEKLQRAVEQSPPRYIFFLHWSWLVPEQIWSRYECVCFHMTDVPYGRGGSPLQNLIVAGHGETKLTALRMVKEMDAGPVYAKRSMTLEGRAEDIYLRAGQLSWEMIDWIIETQPTPVVQQGEIVQFKRRTPEQSVLPAVGSLRGIYDHIRMLDAPTYPAAFLRHGDFMLEFSHAQLEGEEIHARVVLRKLPGNADQS